MKGSCMSQSLFSYVGTPVKAIMPCCALLLSCASVNVAHTAARKQRQLVRLHRHHTSHATAVSNVRTLVGLQPCRTAHLSSTTHSAASTGRSRRAPVPEAAGLLHRKQHAADGRAKGRRDARRRSRRNELAVVCRTQQRHATTAGTHWPRTAACMRDAPRLLACKQASRHARLVLHAAAQSSVF